MKIGILFGDPTTTPGGMALKFYSSVRIELKRIAQIKKGEEIVGSRIKAKIVKNKVAAPFKTAELDIYYNEGISKLIDLINVGLKYEVLKKSGNTLLFGETKLGVGIDAVREFLKQDKKLAPEIHKAVLAKARE